MQFNQNAGPVGSQGRRSWSDAVEAKLKELKLQGAMPDSSGYRRGQSGL